MRNEEDVNNQECQLLGNLLLNHLLSNIKRLNEKESIDIDLELSF